MKRLLDLALAVLASLLLLPLTLVLTILIACKLGRPILFTQVRPGLGGKPFRIYKFRTMTNETDETGQLLPDEVRLTPFGLFLRKYSLDELPQLLNVIRGEISLVGPRPLLMEYLPLYNKRQARRHEVKPGITGWAQVNGRNAVTWEQKFELDVWYVENHTFWLDLKILLLTVYKLFDRQEVDRHEAIIVQDFTGSGGDTTNECSI